MLLSYCIENLTTNDILKKGAKNVPVNFDVGERVIRRRYAHKRVRSTRKKISVDAPILVASRRLTRPLDVAKVDARVVFKKHAKAFFH